MLDMVYDDNDDGGGDHDDDDDDDGIVSFIHCVRLTIIIFLVHPNLNSYIVLLCDIT